MQSVKLVATSEVATSAAAAAASRNGSLLAACAFIKSINIELLSCEWHKQRTSLSPSLSLCLLLVQVASSLQALQFALCCHTVPAPACRAYLPLATYLLS